MIKSDRGIQQSLSQTYFGDIENEIKPDKKFIEEMDKNSNLWAIAQRIEGLKVGYSSHAGGVIISENPITDYCGLMKTTGGDMVTCFDLHEVEAAGLIKIDLLATEALSKMRVCLDLLCENKYIEDKGSLRRTYEEVIGIYNLDRTDKKMWEKVWNNEIIALFQMEQQSGLQGIALTHPSSVEELALLNSVIRLMPADKKATRPLEKFAIFKEDANERILEMLEYGLTEEEQHFINDKLDYSFGIAAHQEDLYALLTSDELGGFSFGDADKLRKAVAKKSPKDYEAFETVFWERVKEKNISRPLANYVWNVLIATQRGYGFNIAHTLSYSLVGLQQMNLATRFPILFWNTANLIIDSGSTGEDFDDINDDDFETAPSDYGKIASAIGKMQDRGINVQPPDINLSNLSFTPVIDTNSILYGMVGIVKVGDSVVQEIMNNRPYTSVEDFLNRVKVNKPQMVNLIKSGAFDCFGNRVKIMNDYIGSIADVKKRLTLQNVATLIKANLIPEQLSFEQRVFFFNKYLRKTLNKKTNMLTLDATSLQFYEQYYDMDKIVSTGGVLQINEKVWKTQYDKEMAKIKKYISENHDNLLITLNTGIINEVKAKYAQGNLAKWSMDSVSFYQKEHELKNLDRHKYAIANFRDLPEEPQVAKSFTTRDGKTINIYQLNRIAGTVIDKNADKSMITLLTTDGVITVLAYGVMAAYDKQISEKQPDGTKKIIESSWFSRGNKIIVNGMRRGSSTFVAKTYANSNTHHFTLINEIKDNGQLDLQEERLENKELEVE